MPNYQSISTRLISAAGAQKTCWGLPFFAGRLRA